MNLFRGLHGIYVQATPCGISSRRPRYPAPLQVQYVHIAGRRAPPAPSRLPSRLEGQLDPRQHTGLSRGELLEHIQRLVDVLLGGELVVEHQGDLGGGGGRSGT